MRRITRIATAGIASAALALSVTACGGGDSSDAGSDSNGGKAAIAYDIGGRGDQSFNDAAYAGLAKAERTSASRAPRRSQRRRGRPGQGPAPHLARPCRQQPGDRRRLRVRAGHRRGRAEVPDTTFGLIDDTSKTGKNIANLVFNEEQGSYLAGVAAAKVTKSNTVGFIGGVETPLIKKFEAGFVQGVKDTNKDVNVKVQYLTQPPDFGGFSKPDLGKAAAQGQIDAGADVIYAAAGLAGSGLHRGRRQGGQVGHRRRLGPVQPVRSGRLQGAHPHLGHQERLRCRLQPGQVRRGRQAAER